MKSTAQLTDTPRPMIQDPLVKKCCSALDIIFADYEKPRPFRVTFWDGTHWESEGEKARFTLVFHHPDGLRRFLCADSETALSEGYIFNDYDILGDLHAAVPVAQYLENKRFSWTEKARLTLLLASLTRTGREQPPVRELRAGLSGPVHSKRRDRQAIAHHYDVSNEFYKLWLDSRMVYSCAYFEDVHDTIDDAQERKLDYICRKLRLKSGEKFLDIGCGWGALIMHAAKYYGVQATGVTLSERQADLAKERIVEAGLAGQCDVRLADYRDLAEDERFDKVASVGMFEHVGRSQFTAYFEKAWNLLKPGGFFLNHAIAEPPAENERPRHGLISAYVFPDGELVPLSEAQTVAETTGFEVRDVESLREHYAMTLDHWVQRLEQNHQKAKRSAGEAIYRLWRLYMAGCSVGFKSGRIQVYQSLYQKADDGPSDHLPMSRSEWYRS